MTPSKVSNSLRHIAAKIDNFVNPKRVLVARDLRRVMAAINDKTKVYVWDEVGTMVVEFEVNTPPTGLSLSQTMDLIDEDVTSQSDTDMETEDKTSRITDKVMVLEGTFGRGKVVRIYYCPDDPNKAKALADQEMHAYFQSKD